MAGSMTLTQEYFARRRDYICECTSDASGDVSTTPFQCQGGSLYKISYNPESGCSDNWDLTLPASYQKADGSKIEWADVLNPDGGGSEGLNLSNSTDGRILSLSTLIPILPGTKLTPTIANLGNAQTVHVIFHAWEEYF